MQRSYKTRPVSGALLTIALLALALVVGMLGAAAEAEDSTPTAPTTPATTADPDASTATTTTPTATPSPEKLLQQLANGPVTAVGEELVLKRGLRTGLNVGANDSCASTCTFQFVSRPSGWPVTLSATGALTFTVPARTVPGTYRIYYRVVDTNSSQNALTAVTVRVTPDNYAAPPRMLFTHPYRKGYRYKIRNHILRSINSVPPGDRIRVASWSFSSKTYYKALNQARKRGVIVQIVLAQRNKAKNSDYRILRRLFGTALSANGSWVRKCRYSCRGVKGTMHSKIFLFSRVYRTPYVMMTGSANLTDFAVTNQWNQMNTTAGNAAIYNEGVRIFVELSNDRPAKPMYVQTTYPTLTNYFYPAVTRSTRTDFMYKALNQVQCRGATNTKDGRTIIKIAMYAWYQDRGKWLAKKVRSLWQDGCRVQIVYGISSNPVKKILFSPSGRGRIPMRQILLTNTKGTPIYYIHDKWVAIKGRYGSTKGTSLAFQGSFNFSDIGFQSDENFQMLPGSSYYGVFSRDFDLLWKDRQARAPSPVSTITNIERTAPASPTLGTGTYRYMEND